MKKHLPAVLTGIGLLILWQVIAMCINAAYILPSPTQIAVKIWELREPLFTVHTPATMLVTLIGLLISVVLGVGLAVVMERFECVDDTGNGDSSALCAVARIRHMEQGACCCAYNILPDNHIGTRRT